MDMTSDTRSRRFGPAILSLLTAALLAGCETLNQQQFQVAPASGGGVQATVATQDREAVKEVLQTVAAELGLKDLTASSLVPEIIVFYSDIDSDYPIKLSARVVKDKIAVDLMHSHPYGGETDRYRRARSVLTSELKAKFGDRTQILPRQRQMGGTPPGGTPPK